MLEFIARNPNHVLVLGFARKIGHRLHGQPPRPFLHWGQYRSAMIDAGMAVFGHLPVLDLVAAFDVSPVLCMMAPASGRRQSVERKSLGTASIVEKGARTRS